MRKTLVLIFVASIALAGCTTSQEASQSVVKEVATAKLMRADGSEAGVATLSLQADGVWLEMSAAAPGAGNFAMHIHSVGQCTAPDFTSAGPHWNPDMRQHGKQNPAGSHAGDLPNVSADANGRIGAKLRLDHVEWTGTNSPFDADGAALIVHERADDYLTDPTGNAGKRVYCGVFTRG